MALVLKTSGVKPVQVRIFAASAERMYMEQFLGWLATILFVVCYIPQIIKTCRTKTVAGLIFWLLFISFIANIVALVYAIMIKQNPLIVKYVLGIIFLVLCIYAYSKIYCRERNVD